MNKTDFDRSIHEQMVRSTSLLNAKNGAYSPGDDKIKHFRVAGDLQDITPAEALAGMMAKHTVSVYELLNTGNVTDISLETWREKITDHVNYLLLLSAIVDDAFKVNYEIPEGPAEKAPVDEATDEVPDLTSVFLDAFKQLFEQATEEVVEARPPWEAREGEDFEEYNSMSGHGGVAQALPGPTDVSYEYVDGYTSRHYYCHGCERVHIIVRDTTGEIDYRR